MTSRRTSNGSPTRAAATRRAILALTLVASSFVITQVFAEGPATTKPKARRMIHPPSTRPRVERPTLTQEEYKSLAQELRAAYSKPPAEWPAPELDPGVEHRELGRLPPVVHPANNPYSEPKADLGRLLFFDGRLSGNGSMSCASCHTAELGFSDGRTTSLGHNAIPVKRNTPSLKHVSHAKVLMWDGRAASLEEQALMPVANPDEMHSTPQDAANRIAAIPGYTKLFESVFGSPEITPERIAMAIACFERTLEWRHSDFDSFVDGDYKALSDSAIRGLHLFRTEARCFNCHNGPLFTDEKFHNLGLTYYGRNLEDLGRYQVTHQTEDVGRFRTPTLRDLSKTGPYMHTGLFDLDGVLNMYEAGMPVIEPTPEQVNDPLFPKKDPLIKPLHLNRQDRADLEAFLQSLDEPRQRIRPPKLP
jgi:cytochrome c peroxidase